MEKEPHFNVLKSETIFKLLKQWRNNKVPKPFGQIRDSIGKPKHYVTNLLSIASNSQIITVKSDPEDNRRKFYEFDNEKFFNLYVQWLSVYNPNYDFGKGVFDFLLKQKKLKDDLNFLFEFIEPPFVKTIEDFFEFFTIIYVEQIQRKIIQLTKEKNSNKIPKDWSTLQAVLLLPLTKERKQLHIPDFF